MKGWIIDQARYGWSRSAAGSPESRERRRGVTVEILLGGFRLSGLLECSARGDRVTFTIMNGPNSAPGERDPETGDEVNAIEPISKEGTRLTIQSADRRR